MGDNIPRTRSYELSLRLSLLLSLASPLLSPLSFRSESPSTCHMTSYELGARVIASVLYSSFSETMEEEKAFASSLKRKKGNLIV